MSTRTIERICLLGLVDLAYRMFLRDIVRQQIGMTAPPPRLGS
jgi:hypothetical protein